MTHWPIDPWPSGPSSIGGPFDPRTVCRLRLHVSIVTVLFSDVDKSADLPDEATTSEDEVTIAHTAHKKINIHKNTTAHHETTHEPEHEHEHGPEDENDNEPEPEPEPVSKNKSKPIVKPSRKITKVNVPVFMSARE